MIKELQDALNTILLGKQEVVRQGVSCLLANGHILLEDIPGMGKTTFSHALAQLTGMHYRRIQFTSDLLPSDLLGISIYDTQKNHFQFHRGPVFSQLILADEINRAPPKTQSALLEAMEEKQVTTDVGTIALPKPFFVIATQNPLWNAGTYPLPESQLDRFLMRLHIGYPPAEAERQLLMYPDLNRDVTLLKPIMSPDELLGLQEETQKVTVSEVVINYVQSLLMASRSQGHFYHGLSPRAGMGLIRAAQGYAMTDNRRFVRPDDIQAVMPAVVDHRLVIKESKSERLPSDILLKSVEVPV